MSDLKQIIKSLLFAWGDPLDLKAISEVCDIDLDLAQEELEN
ncbi:hypothetical protein [Fenollaria sporofastidiosus]|nr:hypothetical protein [Fenollaria sporofastidiosus]